MTKKGVLKRFSESLQKTELIVPVMHLSIRCERTSGVSFKEFCFCLALLHVLRRNRFRNELKKFEIFIILRL